MSGSSHGTTEDSQSGEARDERRHDAAQVRSGYQAERPRRVEYRKARSSDFSVLRVTKNSSGGFPREFVRPRNFYDVTTEATGPGFGTYTSGLTLEMEAPATGD